MGLIVDIQNDLEKGAVRLISEYRARLMSDAIKLCKDASGAEDLVSRTLVKVINKIDSYDDNYDFYVWMKTILVNIHRDDQNRPVTRGTIPVEDGALEQYAGADWSTDEEILRNSDCEFLHEVLKHLDPADRETLLMRYYDGLSLKEIASFLNKPVSTIGRRIQVAVRLLSGKLGVEMRRAKKPLAVLGVLLLGAATLFGAYQAGLVDAIKSVVAGMEESERVEKAENVQVVEEVEEAEARGIDSGSTPVVGADVLGGPQSPDNAGGGRFNLRQESEIQRNTLQQANATQTQEKPTMKLAQTFAAAALAVTAAVVTVEADGVTLQVDQIKQRYPWNGLVDIDYTVTFGQDETLGVDDNLEVLMVDKAVTPAVTNRAINFLQAPLPLTAGSHRITWNANADGVTNRTDAAEYHLKVVHYTESYMVIDVSGGSTTNVYPVDFLNGAPPGGFADREYKGDKIVLRRIHPGSYMAGSPNGEYGQKTDGTEAQHPVVITKPFYIGIFEVTQRQYENVMGSNSNPSKTKLPYHPVEQTIYNTHVRGSGTIPSGNTFIAKLLAKCRSWNAEKQDYADDVAGFDLPTDFQWEYACRAGTTKAFNGTDDFDNTSSDEQKNQLLLLGRFLDNKGSETHAEVGSYQHNAWGLYDMHGNVVELCRDWWHDKAQEIKPYVDPEWVTSSGTRATRGGSYAHQVNACRSAARYGLAPTAAADYHGFRLCRNLP